MEFFLECSTRYLTSECSSLVRYRVENEKRNSISSSNHVLFCLLHKQLINKNKSLIQLRTYNRECVVIHLWR